MALELEYTDVRGKMRRALWSIGTRSATRYIIVHYNGPTVPGAGNAVAELAQLQADSYWHTRPGAFGVASGGDGIQYHGFTDCNGRNYQLRDWSAKLWHAGDAAANDFGLAWHIPIGGRQYPTVAQLAGLWRAIQAFRKWYGTIPAYSVKGHLEVNPSTLCPGTLLPIVRNWRAERVAAVQEASRFAWYELLVNLTVRTAPSEASAPAVLNGAPYVQRDGTRVAADKIVAGERSAYSSWIHRADGYGFMALSPTFLKPVSYQEF